MKAQLVSRPIPISGESPASILIRAVEGNGYPNLQSLIWAYLKHANGKTLAKASYVDPARFTYIISELGIDMSPDDIPAFIRSGPTSESARQLDGMAIPEKLFREDGRFFCPECLRERKYWRKTWTLRPYSVCTVHSKLLIRDCPVCGAELHPWRAKLAECDCGADLRETISEPADTAVINWWLDIHKSGESRTQAIDAALLALSCFDDEYSLPQSEHHLLNAVYEWFEMSKVSRYIQDLVNKQSNSIHPRIQLLPLLRSEHSAVQSLAKAILSSYTPHHSFEIPTTGKAMQALEAELALGITRRALKKFRDLGLINRHPDSIGGVSFDDVNRILFAMHAARGDPTQGEGRAQTKSLASMVMDALSGKRVSAGYDIPYGLTTLRLVPSESEGAAVAGTNGELLNVHQV